MMPWLPYLALFALVMSWLGFALFVSKWLEASRRSTAAWDEARRQVRVEWQQKRDDRIAKLLDLD